MSDSYLQVPIDKRQEAVADALEQATTNDIIDALGEKILGKNNEYLVERIMSSEDLTTLIEQVLSEDGTFCRNLFLSRGVTALARIISCEREALTQEPANLEAYEQYLVDQEADGQGF